MGLLFNEPRTQVLDGNGNVYSGAKLNFYETGTTTRLDTYSDETLATANANPVVADSAGRFGAIFLKRQAYKVVLADTNDTTIWTQDPVNGMVAYHDKGADVAAAATLTLGEDGDYFDITDTSGPTTITSIASLGIGTEVTLHMDAQTIFQHHATDLVLPGAANITAEAGDEFKFREYASADWRCINFTRASKLPILQGTHTFWIRANDMEPTTTNGGASATVELATNDVMLKVLDFDASTEEHAQFDVRMPKSWDEGTFTAEFHWTAASGSGDVVWGMEALAVGNDDAMDAAFGTAVTVTDTLITANDDHATSATGACTAAGTPAAGDRVIFQFFRKAADAADTLAVDARLIGVAIFYTVDADNDA